MTKRENGENPDHILKLDVLFANPRSRQTGRPFQVAPLVVWMFARSAHVIVSPTPRSAAHFSASVVFGAFTLIPTFSF
jgi:hypothetical protein